MFFKIVFALIIPGFKISKTRAIKRSKAKNVAIGPKVADTTFNFTRNKERKKKKELMEKFSKNMLVKTYVQMGPNL